MATEKTNGNTGEGEVKKKKYSVVFRQQNSQQNSLKTRPQGSGPARKPSSAPQQQTSKAKPASAASQKPQSKPSADKDQTKGAAETKEPVKQPALKPAAKPDTSSQTEKTVSAEVKAAEKPAEKTPVQASPEQKTKAAAPAGPEKMQTAAGKFVPSAEAKTPAKQPEEQKPAEPARPTPRFVDLNQVRAAEQEAKNRSARLAKQQSERRAAAAAGQNTRSGSRDQSGYNSRGTQGQRSNDSRNFSGTGSRTNSGTRTDNRRPMTSRSGGGAPSGGPSRSASAGGFSAPISGKADKNKKAQRQAGAAKDNSRYNRESDEMRRPGGKNARGKGGSIKDLEKAAKQVKSEKTEPQIKTIVIPETITIQELANAMKMQPAAIIKKQFLAGKVYTVNTEIDYDTAADIALDYDVIAEMEEKVDVIAELLKDSVEDKPEDLVPRPPVVCVMGHVDHGKTSLLDAIRKTNVTSGEAGGITQHIGAYMVEINGQKITFLDTPGHEAFTAMRMRGAQATDIAILVVAADDGVMPQTVEAINHAKAADVEIVVAINKIDKPGANVDKVKQELMEYGLIGEEWGGTNIFVPVSAKKGTGIEELLEMLLLVAEMHELKANPNRKARGMVIEAQLDSTRGPVATVLVQKGTLKVGDTVAAGGSYGKIRAMLNDKGDRVKEAAPGTPVEILGLNSVPAAGEVFIAANNEKEARSYAETFIAEERKKLLDETKSRLKLDDIFSQIQSGSMKELNLIVKADVQGSVEAVKQSLTKLSNEEVAVKVIHSGAGNITESDVTLAAASNAIIIGFNVAMPSQVKSIAESEKVDVRLYDIIYKAIEDVENAMLGILEPVYEEQIIGHAEIRQTFKASGVGTIAGCYVLDGKIQRGCKCRILHEGRVIFDGNLASLKRFKDDVKEVASGYECGLVFEKFGEFTEGDTVEAYVMVQVERKLK